ncbi:thioredoxin family protein [Salinicoccus hispanicus]|uniref:Thioredoxin family protein n=1 Tax=Salinicoccus hispanicus TaxID=157225 RepID=A0A6N8U320_9STAP|nr:thioredoxin family protein [Salinicoccus hispanicus]MXQ50795.1 thioredoxin family protein [Salinicoccus hispanicus]
MALDHWYDQAIVTETYKEGMAQHRQNLQKVYDKFQIPEDNDFFRRLEARSLRVIAITEDWCGDAMMNIPILLHLAEKSHMQVRMILRDSNLELMDQYLTNGKSRSIPIFIFIDENGEEVTHWRPRAEAVQNAVDQLMGGLPDKETPEYDAAFKEAIKTLTARFVSDEEMWHETYGSIKEKLEKNI